MDRKTIFVLIIVITDSSSLSRGERLWNTLINTTTRVEIPGVCINKLVKTHFKCGTVLTVVSSKRVNIEHGLIQEVVKEDCYSVIIQPFEHNKWLIKTEVYIILAEDIFEYSTGVSVLATNILWNPTAKFIIYIRHAEVNSVFTTLLAHKVYNAVYLSNTEIGTEMHTYYPFKNNNCGRKFISAFNLGLCNATKHMKESFTDKVPNSLKGCTLRVALHEEVPNVVFPSSNRTLNGRPLMGLEQVILNSVAKREGLKLHYIEVGLENRFGVVQPNFTATGVLKYLQKDEADVAAGGFVITHNRLNMFDVVWGYNFDTFNLFTLSQPEEDWKKIYQEFSAETWIVIALFCIFFPTLFAATYTLLNTAGVDHGSLTLKLWGYLFYNTSQKLNATKNVRSMLACWIWFTFLITNCYNIAFFSLITAHSKISQHVSWENLQEYIYSTKYNPCISVATRAFFKNTINLTLNKNYGHGSDCTYAENNLLNILSNPDLFAIEKYNAYELLEDKFLDDEGRSVLDSTVVSSFIVNSMYTVRGFPLRDKIQSLMRRLFDTGILGICKALVKFRVHKALKKHRRTFKHMTTESLGIPFAILILGQGMSFASFMVELYINRRK